MHAVSIGPLVGQILATRSTHLYADAIYLPCGPKTRERQVHLEPSGLSTAFKNHRLCYK